MPNDQATNQQTTPQTNPETSTTSTNPTNPPLPNDPASRTATGEIIDQSKVPADGKTDDKGGDTGKKSEGEGAVPESYTFATGEDQHLDEAAIGEITPIFKELKLDQAGVDKLTGFYNKRMADLQTRLQDSVNTMREGWRNDIAADKEMGGKVDAIKTDIGKMWSHLPPDVVSSFKEAMDITGVGDHPAIVKGLWKIAALVNEGRPVPPNNPSPHGQSKPGSGPVSIASAMYPNLPQ